MNWGAKNFLVRSRDTFAAQNLMVAVIDAPSDQQHGMNAIFRMSARTRRRHRRGRRYLKTQARCPVWLVGTSMGTFSAADGAIGAKSIDGLVLTSTITRSEARLEDRGQPSERRRQHGAAAGHRSDAHRVHRKDGCDITPAADAPKLSARLSKAKRSKPSCSTAAIRRSRTRATPSRSTDSSGSKQTGGRDHRRLHQDKTSERGT